MLFAQAARSAGVRGGANAANLNLNLNLKERSCHN